MAVTQNYEFRFYASNFKWMTNILLLLAISFNLAPSDFFSLWYCIARPKITINLPRFIWGASVCVCMTSIVRAVSVNRFCIQCGILLDNYAIKLHTSHFRILDQSRMIGIFEQSQYTKKTVIWSSFCSFTIENRKIKSKSSISPFFSILSSRKWVFALKNEMRGISVLFSYQTGYINKMAKTASIFFLFESHKNHKIRTRIKTMFSKPINGDDRIVRQRRRIREKKTKLENERI